jgi:transposase
MLTRPDALTGEQKVLLSQLTSARAEMPSLAGLIRSFAALLKPCPGNQAKLTGWTEEARACDLPNLHAFTRGLDLDIDAATAAVTLPYHNGRTEGVNTKTKLIKRQMYGRAGFALLRHRILLGLTTLRHHRKCARAVEITVPNRTSVSTFGALGNVRR